VNEKLFVRYPEQTEPGRKIIQLRIGMIYKNVFKAFTFKNLQKTLVLQKQTYIMHNVKGVAISRSI
jgi:hypothetical protein